MLYNERDYLTIFLYGYCYCDTDLTSWNPTPPPPPPTFLGSSCPFLWGLGQFTEPVLCQFVATSQGQIATSQGQIATSQGQIATSQGQTEVQAGVWPEALAHFVTSVVCLLKVMDAIYRHWRLADPVMTKHSKCKNSLWRKLSLFFCVVFFFFGEWWGTEVNV